MTELRVDGVMIELTVGDIARQDGFDARLNTSRADLARARINSFQAAPWGMPISSMMASAMPSRTAPLFATLW